VNLETTSPTTTITQSIIEISKSGSENILASHPRERLLRVIVEENSAAELTDHQRLNGLREGDKVIQIHLEKSLIDKAEVLGDILLKVPNIEGFGHHIEPTLHMLRSIIVIVPHSTLRNSPKLLVTAFILPLMKVVWVREAKATPSLDGSCTQVLCDLWLLFHIHRATVSTLALPGWMRPARLNHLGPHMLPCRTAVSSCGLPSLTSTTWRASLNLIKLPLLDLKGSSIFFIVNPVVTVLSRKRV
jgi:hypothetical protein